MSDDVNDDDAQGRTSERYLSTKDIAHVLGVSVKTLERWRQAGKAMPDGALLFDHTIRYPASEVQRWLKSHGASGSKAE